MSLAIFNFSYALAIIYDRGKTRLIVSAEPLNLIEFGLVVRNLSNLLRIISLTKIKVNTIVHKKI